MRRVLPVVMIMATLSSCGSEEKIQDAELNNERIFGTVISIKRTSDTNLVDGGDMLRSGAARTANTVTGGMFSGWLDTSNSSRIVNNEGVAYVIQADDGRRINVQSTGERVYYPGEEIMVIRNGAGYANVYPRDLSRAHPGGL